ncbi:short-chain dehydrogenase/reductase-like protein [Coniochaeta sp. 2T2.1]|nr:short-chain dehydrogenase/reductase-like protein [Coniochaeta sp. 2T2.1]
MSRFLELVKYQSSMLTNMVITHLLHQQFLPLPLPSSPSSFAGQTVLVTGANSGLGLEASRHFVRLGAARVILACRSLEAGEAAGRDIVRSAAATTTPAPKGVVVVEVWEVDLAVFDSVRRFCRRVDGELERLDVVVLNAGVAVPGFEAVDGGFERQVGVNVVGTFLMALGVLGKLREGKGEEGRMVFVASDGHHFARFPERHQPSVFDAFRDPSTMSDDRYNTTKLLVVLLARELAARLRLGSDQNNNNSSNNVPIVSVVTPGFCKSRISRNLPLAGRLGVGAFLAVIGRTTEAGSRTLVAAAAAGEEAHGGYMESCRVGEPSVFVRSDEGGEVQKRVWGELMEVLEGIESCVTGVVG